MASRRLDPYATPGWRESFGLKELGWKGVLALATALVTVAGAVAYGWMTNSAPVTADQALEEFRRSSAREHAPREVRTTSKRPAGAHTAKEKSGADKAPRKGAAPRPGAAPKLAAAGAGEEQATEDQAPSARAASRNESANEYGRRAPREGVYSWDTEGWESAGGARRNFPEESQRIFNHENGGWFQHHYFSEQREIWTRFKRLEGGAAIAMQRNKVTFGPVTEDSTIDFAPPMLVGPRDLEVGQTWSGRWSGKTSGIYRGETFEHVRLDIGGEQVEAWGIHLDMQMRGEIEGEVEARVWLAPEYAMTVREHYKQRVKADVGDYRAEWTMTLKSLEPRT